MLGLKVVFEFGWPAGTPVADEITGLEGASARSVMLSAGNSIIEIFQYTSPEPASGDPKRPVCNHGITHLCFDVIDLDAEYERLAAAGMLLHCPPKQIGMGLKATYGRDPDGNVIELQEILSEKSPIRLVLQPLLRPAARAEWAAPPARCRLSRGA